MGLKDQERVFTVLGGMTYAHQNRPPFWHNETPLLWDTSLREDMGNLPLHMFPLIADFEVLLEKMEVLPAGGTGDRRCPFGYHIYFFSSPRGYIASFPWWDHAEQDLRREGFSVPLGTLDQPYSDLEQGWIIAIASSDHFVYVVEGDFDRVIVDHSYHTWFKVPEDRYLEQWQRAIQTCHQLGRDE